MRRGAKRAAVALTGIKPDCTIRRLPGSGTDAVCAVKSVTGEIGGGGETQSNARPSHGLRPAAAAAAAAVSER
jgi:hypothetical protein